MPIRDLVLFIIICALVPALMIIFGAVFRRVGALLERMQEDRSRMERERIEAARERGAASVRQALIDAGVSRELVERSKRGRHHAESDPS